MGLMPLDTTLGYTKEWHERLVRLDLRIAFDHIGLLLGYLGLQL